MEILRMDVADPKAVNNNQISEYVEKNIDVAIEQGWVKIYYQPVIRTLTGELCGA